MAMLKKLAKVGSSYSIIVDKPIMQLLSITPDTMLEVRTDGKSLIITPIDNEKEIEHNAKVKKAFERSTDKYKNLYKKLAQ